jgi:hypothetical protein
MVGPWREKGDESPQGTAPDVFYIHCTCMRSVPKFPSFREL